MPTLTVLIDIRTVNHASSFVAFESLDAFDRSHFFYRCDRFGRLQKQQETKDGLERNSKRKVRFVTKEEEDFQVKLFRLDHFNWNNAFFLSSTRRYVS